MGGGLNLRVDWKFPGYLISWEGGEVLINGRMENRKYMYLW